MVAGTGESAAAATPVGCEVGAVMAAAAAATVAREEDEEARVAQEARPPPCRCKQIHKNTARHSSPKL